MDHKKSITAVLAVLLLAIVAGSVAMAGPPRLISYEGFLSDSQGDPKSGSFEMTFAIYDTPESGTALWSSGKVTVQIDNGSFSYLLGSNSELLPEHFEGADRWVGVRIHPDVEMTPRTRLTSVPFTLQASRAEEAGFAYQVADNSIDSTKIIDGSIRLSDIAQDGAADGQVMKWNGAAWIADSDETAEDRADCGWTKDGSIVHTTTAEDLVRIGGVECPSKLTVNDGDIGIAKDGGRLIFDSPTEDYWNGSGLRFEHNKHVVFEGDGLRDQEFSFRPKWVALTIDFDAKVKVYGKGAGTAAWSNYIEVTHDGTDGKLSTGSGDLVLNPLENVSIGTAKPALANLHIQDEDIGLKSAHLMSDKLVIEAEDAVLGLYSSPALAVGSAIYLGEIDLAGDLHDKWAMYRETSGEGSGLRFTYGTNSSAYLNPSKFYVSSQGRAECNSLKITGGMDLAEPFEISNGELLSEGTLVVIDETNPGKLTISRHAYDTRVAGIISGAGGVNPGLILTQGGLDNEGRYIAMSGRAYCLADAAYGSISPGDLLTTSTTPGHAMKATDRSLAHGAIIGKAMTHLDEGKGLVLVLVNLQ